MKAIIKRKLFTNRRRDVNVAAASIKTLQEPPQSSAICASDERTSPTKDEGVEVSDTLGTDEIEVSGLQCVNNIRNQMEHSNGPGVLSPGSYYDDRCSLYANGG